MQISRKKKIFKIIASVLLIAVVIVALNEALCFALEPDDRSSESKAMWSCYREQGELDTIYVGSSFCVSSFDPDVIDAEAGTRSYNMGTYGQPLPQSYVAIEAAIKEHHINTAVLALGYYSLRDSDKTTSAEVAFLHAEGEGLSLLSKAGIAADYIIQPDNISRGVSINYFSPWIYNHVNFAPADIINNVKQKVGGKYEEADWEDLFRKGCVTDDSVMNYNDKEQTEQTSRAMYGNKPASQYGPDQLDRICSLCKKNGCRLIVINTPRPVYDVLSYGTEEYFSQMQELTSFLDEHGASYYDFNFARPELFESKPEYYSNNEHMNTKGSKAFSKSFGLFLKECTSGASLDKIQSEFYTPEEFLIIQGDFKR